MVTLISILLLNPLPIIYGAPTEKTNNHLKLPRQKRQINYNNNDFMINRNVFISEEKIRFEGLIGCKYVSNLCNSNEVCFDGKLVIKY